MDAYHWTCPFCNRDATIKTDNVTSNTTFHAVEGPNKAAFVYFITCPNLKCRKVSFSVTLFDAVRNDYSGRWEIANPENAIRWELVPESGAKPQPDFIPAPIVADYAEACLIKDKSPKASATLARRCIQGILRDFWKVKPGRLVDEIEQAKDKMDPLTWDAIDSVRSVGNIGAHMERDINLVIDVEPNEAQLLIELIEILFRDWYVNREEKRKKLESIKAIAADKKQLKNPA